MVVMRRTRLRWFDHVVRREDHVRQLMNFEVESRSPAGRPKKTWREVLEEDLRVINIFE